MICRTPEEALRAGLAAPCQHGIHPMSECDTCRLTDAEIGRLAVLLRSSAVDVGGRSVSSTSSVA